MCLESILTVYRLQKFGVGPVHNQDERFCAKKEKGNTFLCFVLHENL